MALVQSGVTAEGAFHAETIAAERAAAEKWVKAYQQYEDDLLRAGKDVNDEANYAAFYRKHGQAREALGFSPEDLLPRNPLQKAVLLITSAAVAVILLLALLARRRGRKHRAARLPAAA
jgi:hypothetical protein